ncbi:MAG: hypothetical protein J1E56_06160 [Ruminococcus sp.]|nr:hypothetical protein [Ruminococcus sp.]
MKKSLKNKKLFFSCVFVVLGLSILAFNLSVFPQFLKMTPDVSAIEKITNEEIEVNKTNDVIGNIISERRAIEIAKKGVSDELASSEPLGVEIGPTITDIDRAQVVARYVTEDVSFPSDDPMWIVIIVGQKEDFTAPMPDGITIEDVVEIAVEKGLVWEDENGKLMAYYKKLTELTYVRVNAITGGYGGYKCLTSVDDLNLKFNIEWLNDKYNTDFGLSELDL